MLACGGNPWSVAGAPDVPPDAEFRTGVEAGEDVFIWECYKGSRVVVRQFGSACFGTRAPVLDKGPCGAPLAIEGSYAGVHHDNIPDSRRWPGTPEGGLPPMIPDAGAPDVAATIAVEASAPLAVGVGESGAVKKATAEANAALDRAYAKSSKRPGAVASPHSGAWVTEQTAHAVGDGKSGWRVTWSSHPPAGFEYDATVTVSPSGETNVTRAEATFSPD